MDENGLPDKVNAAAINSWLFNEDTVDKALQHLMEHGHQVEAGDRLAKTILFARNHQHAKFIEERFNHHYTHYKGHFARIIDHYAKYPQSLLDDFSQKNKPPHIAISVDMLDTGIDVPEVANLVFFKPVYSKIKFWQMIGRGTRLCPELFGPDDDKQDFRVFDFCFNFDFFRENPQGMEVRGAVPLGTRLFRSRVQLLAHAQASPDLDPDGALAKSLTTDLHGKVAIPMRSLRLVPYWSVHETLGVDAHNAPLKMRTRRIHLSRAVAWSCVRRHPVAAPALQGSLPVQVSLAGRQTPRQSSRPWQTRSPFGRPWRCSGPGRSPARCAGGSWLPQLGRSRYILVRSLAETPAEQSCLLPRSPG